VSVRTELINTARGLVKSMGTRLPRGSSPSFAEKVKEAIPDEVRDALLPLVQLTETVNDCIARYDQVPTSLQARAGNGSETQFSGASFLSGFGFPFVPRRKLIGLVPTRFSRSCFDYHSYPASIRTLKEPQWARCTLGFDLKPGPITIVTRPGWLGAAI
jgi:hypothetical protein